MIGSTALDDAKRAALTAVAEQEAEQAQLFARRMRTRAEIDQLWEPTADCFEVIELAGTARIGQNKAATQLTDGTRLTTILTGTLALLEQGVMYQGAAELLLTLTRHCTPEVQAEVERRLLTQLATANTTDARRALQAAIPEVEADLNPDLTTERLNRARRERTVWIAPLTDGMCQIGATLDVLRGRRWALDFEELVRAQKILDDRQGHSRTQAQRRADVFAELPSRLRALIHAIQQGNLTALLDLARQDPAAANDLETFAAATTDLTPDTDETPAADETLVAEPGNTEPADETPASDPVQDEPVQDEPTMPASKWLEADDTEPGNTEPDNTKPDNTEPDNTAPDNAESDGSGVEPTGQDTRCEPAATSPPDPPDPPPDPHSDRDADPDGTDRLTAMSWDDLAVELLRLPVHDPQVLNVHIPMSTVLDLDNRSGMLEGIGAVPAERIRVMLPDAALRKVYVERTTGIPVGIDPHIVPPPAPLPAFTQDEPTDPTPTRKPSQPGKPAQTSERAQARAEQTRARLLALLAPAVIEHLAEPRHDPSRTLTRLIELRDLRCTGIGCHQPASRCDTDHELRYPDGPTAEWNLSSKSRRCHHAKHHGWTVQRHDDGHLTWTSPLGHSYTRAGVWQPPRPLPDHLTLPAPRPARLDDTNPWPQDNGPLWNERAHTRNAKPKTTKARTSTPRADPQDTPLF